MFKSTTGSGARQRSLGLLATGAVVAGLLAATPAADAAQVGKAAALSAPSGFGSGRYVVLLREPSATRYAGGNPRYDATKARPGQPFDARSADVRVYTDHLRSTQRSIAGTVDARPAMSYTIASNGFAADLTTQQAMQLQADRRVLMVQKDTMVHADTWHTPTFLGMTGDDGAWTTHGGQKKAGDGVVIADLDSGIWPESRSFQGQALTSQPKTKWDITRNGNTIRMEKFDGGVFTGECEVTADFPADSCNAKLISARSYSEGYLAGGNVILPEDYASPRDGNGHGTHTASTAGGRVVDHVKTEGIKFGSVSGMAPAAKIAAYKVLWAQEDGTASGLTSDIVAAIDDATADGADVLNFSISGATDTIIDLTEIVFEGAAEAGVFIAASAGNSGPDASTVAHNSPWLTTVAASTHYNFENTLVLGNGKKIVGASISKSAVPPTTLVDSAASGVAGGDPDEAALCAPDSLDPAAVTGTIVVCTRGVYDRVAKSAEVARAGGVGMVLANPSENSLDADFHSVPTIHITVDDAEKVFNYLEEAGGDATAEFVLGNITKHQTPLPQVAGFSSRGPAIANDADLLKPDIAAPGVSVLAAVAPPSNHDRKYDLYSGTSMAAPHITGLAAFIAGVRPNWTPMQIKSAMMTTAKKLKNEEGNPSNDVFGGGAGQVTPKKFFNPGLFVTSTPREWLGFISGQGLPTGVAPLAAKDLNGPSMAQGQVTSSTTFTRRFVAAMAGTWKVTARVPGFTAVPSASTLTTKRPRDIESLDFEFTRTTAPLGEFALGWVKLTGPTTIKIPVALRPVSVKAPAMVSGSGTDGSLEVPVTAGFTGDLAVGTSGLDKAEVVDNAVDVNDYNLECVPVADGNELARFDLDAADDTSDLDMYVYHSTSCSTSDIDAFMGQSATGAADETVTLENAPAGSYIIEVDGFAAGSDGAPMTYQLRAYDVGPAATAGDLTVTPNPVPVVNGEETTFDVSWTGLDAGAFYLGLLKYDGALAPTMVEITS